MVRRYKGMIATGVWIPEKLLISARESNPGFNLSHYLSNLLQKDFGGVETIVENKQELSIEDQVDMFLKNRVV